MATTARAAARARVRADAQQPVTVSPTEGTPRWTCTISMTTTSMT
jgi:hypothetical protein